MEKYINKLPQDIKYYIYSNFFKEELLYEKFNKELETEESKYLNCTNIVPYIPIIISKIGYINYFSSKLPFFNSIYKDHIINDKKTFVLMNNQESFAQCILMYMYH
jgi:hypothetical protein